MKLSDRLKALWAVVRAYWRQLLRAFSATAPHRRTLFRDAGRATAWLLLAFLFVVASYPFLDKDGLLVTAAPFVTLGLLSQALFRFGRVVSEACARLRSILKDMRKVFGEAWQEGITATIEAKRRDTVATDTRVVSNAAGALLAACAVSLLLFGLLLLVKLSGTDDSQLVLVEEVRLSTIQPVVATVFFAEEAQFSNWQQYCRPHLDEQPSVADQDQIEKVLQLYSRCATIEEKVAFEVRGFASSSLGGGWGEDEASLSCEDSGRWEDCLSRQECSGQARGDARLRCVARAFNLCVAQYRASEVANWWKGRTEEESSRNGLFEVRVRQWKDHDEMAAHRPVLDRRDDEYRPQLGAVNRSVEVALVDAGVCEVARSEVAAETKGQKRARKAKLSIDSAMKRAGDLLNRTFESPE